MKATYTFPLTEDFHEIEGNNRVTVQGPHRFLQIGSITGYHPTSLKTCFHIDTDLHQKNEGAIALWISPLETLSVAPPMSGYLDADYTAREYGILADAFPNNNPKTNIFGWVWRSTSHPQMPAKFKEGGAGGGNADFGVTPYVPVEHLPLIEKQWYELILTWNKEKSRLYIYVNGILCGTTSYPFQAVTPHPALYMGNTAMVFSNLRFFDKELSADQVAAEWSKMTSPGKSDAEKEIASLHCVQPRAKMDWQPNAQWSLEYDNPLLAEGSFSDWIQQGCLAEGYALKELRHTSDGLLMQTPDQIGLESRVYFWSPKIFEGDLAVEFDFRPEGVDGLALLVVQATGMQREDFINDHPLRTTGSMKTIIGDRVRNYHWEFFRHSVDVRGDIGTSVVFKNPWQHPLGFVSHPLLAPGKWCKLQFVQEGNRLRAAINGEVMIDVEDSPTNNNGPIFNSGRIGIRLMYQTKMTFRHLKVWNKARDRAILDAKH